MDTQIGERATMGEGCSLKRQLLGAVSAVVIGLTVVIGANDPWAKVYGDQNGGVVVGLGHQACIGFELWGAPGFFGSLTDAGACDY